MKKKILFFGWEDFEWKRIEHQIKKVLVDDFESVFAKHDVDALHEIVQAKFLQKNPISAIVFNRRTLVVNHRACKLIAGLAERYYGIYLVTINLIYNDQDTEAKNCAVGSNFAKCEDWKQLAVIIKNKT
jgi:hypothetical protein